MKHGKWNPKERYELLPRWKEEGLRPDLVNQFSDLYEEMIIEPLIWADFPQGVIHNLSFMESLMNCLRMILKDARQVV